MGFWDSLTKGKADAMAAVKRLKDNDIAAAAMAAAAAVAMADGKLDPEEKDKVAGHITRSEYLKQYEQSKLIAMFEEHVSNIKFSSRTGVSGALKVIGKLAGSPEKAEAALLIAISIADEGGIGDEEKVVLGKIADALNLSLSNYNL